MDDAALAALIGRIHIEGWDVALDGRTVSLHASNPPHNARGDGIFDGLGEQLRVPHAWDVMHILRRLFATVQYLSDHELREGFDLDGYRPFDPHLPVSVTGQQHDWFVEAESAVRGY